jgi:hypothetical protein
MFVWYHYKTGKFCLAIYPYPVSDWFKRIGSGEWERIIQTLSHFIWARRYHQ